jgi:hypothetical protein
MTHERYDDWASDPVLTTVEEVKARIHWLNEMLKQLQFKAAAKDTIH